MKDITIDGADFNSEFLFYFFLIYIYFIKFIYLKDTFNILLILLSFLPTKSY